MTSLMSLHTVNRNAVPKATMGMKCQRLLIS